MNPVSKPQSVDISDCHFYHSIDIDNQEHKGEWDLRKSIPEYLGSVDLTDKSVLECGPANGVISNYLENNCKSFSVLDLDTSLEWDVVPFENVQEDRIVNMKKHLQQIQNAFWYNYIKRNSNYDVYHSNLYNADKIDEKFEVSLLGAILIHVRDPLLALEKVSKVTEKTLVITEFYPKPTLKMKILFKLGYSFDQLIKYAPDTPVFTPHPDKPKENFSWWSLPPKFLISYLKILGFNQFTTKASTHLYMDKPIHMYTLIANR
jgi:hypothetical protein